MGCESSYLTQASAITNLILVPGSRVCNLHSSGGRSFATAAKALLALPTGVFVVIMRHQKGRKIFLPLAPSGQWIFLHIEGELPFVD